MNVTAEGISAFCSAFIWFYGVVISINQVRKGFNYKFYHYAIFAYSGISLFLFLWGIASFFLIIALAKVALIGYTLGAFFVLLVSDSLNREQVEPVKLSIFQILGSTAIVFLYLFPNFITETFTTNGSVFYFVDPILALPFLFACALSFMYYLYCIFLVNKKAPSKLKGYSRVYLSGMSLCVFAFCFWVTAGPTFPGFAFTFAGVGGFLMEYAFFHEPKLLFVLPFTAIRLTVLETTGGLPIFTHTWNRERTLAEESLFSGILQGVRMIIQESLRSGDVQEIQVAEAIILIHKIPNYPVACVLVATRPTQSLRDGLRLFTERFYGEFYSSFENLNNTDQFSGAEDLISACFPHVPVYD